MERSDLSFSVMEYNENNLQGALFKGSCKEGEIDKLVFAPYNPGGEVGITKDCIQGTPKWHYKYFREYLGDNALAAKTIIIEWDYRDHDFLSDFADYYVRCFSAYPRHCRRVHFFKTSISEKQLLNFLQYGTCQMKDDMNNELEKLQDGYLGFITIKPLPAAIIGRTCLATYPSEDNGKYRHFPIVRKYKVNFFGIDLSVNTLAFQEQDRVVSACATSALWVVLQDAPDVLRHHIPSPVEITKMAGEHWSGTRVLPNDRGLTANQMTYTLQKHGMQPQALQPASKKEFLSLIYAYSHCRLPILQNVRLLRYSAKQQQDTQDNTKFLGNHALVITGYKTNDGADKKENPPDVAVDAKIFRLYADTISELYVHDDNIGPFARAYVHDGCTGQNYAVLSDIVEELQKTRETSSDQVKFFIKSGVHGNDISTDSRVDIIATPISTIIPLHPKMRIPFATISDLCEDFHSEYCNIIVMDTTDVAAIRMGPKCYFIHYWDIYLTTVNDYKREIFSKNDTLPYDVKQKILSQSLPRFLWVAKAIGYGDRPDDVLVEMVFDATDIESDNMLAVFLVYNEGLRGLIREWYNSPTTSFSFRMRRIFNRWLDNVSSDREVHLLYRDDVSSSTDYDYSFIKVPESGLTGEKEDRADSQIFLDPDKLENKGSSEWNTFSYEVHCTQTYKAVESIIDKGSALRIAEANNDVDGGVFGVIRWFFGFDGEKLAIHYLRKLFETSEKTQEKARIIFIGNIKRSCFCLKMQNRILADQFLGIAMHTLQDSYAHSDENGKPISSANHKNILKGFSYVAQFDNLQHPRNKHKIQPMENATKQLIAAYLQEMRHSFIDSQQHNATYSTIQESSLPLTCEKCRYWENQTLFGMLQQTRGCRDCQDNLKSLS